MTPAQPGGAFPAAARWCSAAVLGGLGVIGVMHGLAGSPRPAVPRTEPVAITIPTQPPPQPQPMPQPEATPPAPLLTEAAPIEPPATVHDGSVFAATAEVGIQKLIAVNTASAAELELLPGVGPVMAQRIIDDRAANGPFRTPADLDRVRGIGPRTLEKLTPLVRFD